MEAIIAFTAATAANMASPRIVDVIRERERARACMRIACEHSPRLQECEQSGGHSVLIIPHVVPAAKPSAPYMSELEVRVALEKYTGAAAVAGDINEALARRDETLFWNVLHHAGGAPVMRRCNGDIARVIEARFGLRNATWTWHDELLSPARRYAAYQRHVTRQRLRQQQARAYREKK